MQREALLQDGRFIHTWSNAVGNLDVIASSDSVKTGLTPKGYEESKHQRFMDWNRCKITQIQT